MFPAHFLEELRARIDIVELVGQYVPLKKAGTSFAGLCPFHKEKSPSFHVHPQKQCFHCFGCHKGGNVFTFLCAIEGLSFPDAVRKLADRVGIAIVEERRSGGPRRPEPQAPPPETQRLYDALEWAAKYFHYLLLEHRDYESVRAYVKSRGLLPETLRRFRIGASPRGWSTLLDTMARRGFSTETLVAAGLAVPKEGSPGKAYDRFRERLMFPILDPSGRVVGFGARILEETLGQPSAKYLNSPESALFSKRRILYGLSENQRGIRLRGEAVLVEGYMDVVGLAQAGVDNAVATMGTAVTEEHCRNLRKLTKRVTTVFDPDRAGAEAWHRSVHLFLQAGLFAKDLTLPDGKDPDEYVREAGAEAFYAQCAQAPRQVTKLLKEIAGKRLSEEERAKALELLTPILVASRALPDRALLWDDIALALRVSVESLRAIAETAAARLRVGAPETKPPGPKPPIRLADLQKRRGRPTVDVLTREFFRAALLCPKPFLALPESQWKPWLREERRQTLLTELHGLSDESAFRQALERLSRTESDGDIAGQLVEAALQEGPTPEQLTEFQALVRKLDERRRKDQVHQLATQAKFAEKLGSGDDPVQLLDQMVSILRVPPADGESG
jgi:DNA primase